MDLRFTADQQRFRDRVRDWLTQQLEGPYRALLGAGGPGREHTDLDERRQWERELGRAGWIGLAWPASDRGSEASLLEQVIFHEEYARAQAPGRVGHIGEYLLAPTLIAFGTEDQRRRFLPAIAQGEQLWCQGYSEPNAGSDLAGVQTRAKRDGDIWRITGQKTWTSHAAVADWCFALCRTTPESTRHAGLSYILVPMRQSGIEVRPIRQLTGTAEYCEVFFDGAVAADADIVGGVGNGWKVAMGTLQFERGASTLGQQLGFATELQWITDAARETGMANEPTLRLRLARAWIGLRVMRCHALRTLSGAPCDTPAPETMINKLFWATWHRELGELAMDVLGRSSEVAASWPYTLTPLQQIHLFSRADTIYAGSNEIQRDIIAIRALGLPRGPR